MKTKQLITLVTFLSVSAASWASNVEEYAIYQKAVNETSKMNQDPASLKAAKAVGLNITNVTWEDVGRSMGSSVGPNISDMTIQVHTVNKRGDISPVAMPVVRYPNFSDKTADISPNKFMVPVGNEVDGTLTKVSLTEYLDNLRTYLNDGSSWKGSETSLLAPRDTHVLVSAQAAFLPIPKGQKASFNPVLFNYQSGKDNPAVLSILVTRQGTSATIIDNTRDAFKAGRFSSARGQRLFFNKNGERASLTGTRQSDFDAETANTGSATATDSLASANGGSGMNMVMLIQVPLVHKARPMIMMNTAFPASSDGRMRTTSMPVEDAVIGHGPIEGKFTEIDNMEIKRDTRFPIRVTVQFYKATDSKVLTPKLATELRRQIDSVYKNADYVGSLVTEGITGRPTQHNVKYCYRPWFPRIWPIVINEREINEDEGVNTLRQFYGRDWVRYCKTPAFFTSALEFVTTK